MIVKNQNLNVFIYSVIRESFFRVSTYIQLTKTRRINPIPKECNIISVIVIFVFEKLITLNKSDKTATKIPPISINFDVVDST